MYVCVYICIYRYIQTYIHTYTDMRYLASLPLVGLMIGTHIAECTRTQSLHRKILPHAP